MGADAYQTDTEVAEDLAAGLPTVGVGDYSYLDGVIVDKNCRIGQGVHIEAKPELTAAADSLVAVQDGIIVVPKQTTLADGWRM